MRWHIIRTLWHKELLRHAANRGGILLVVLLMLASLLLSFFGPQVQSGGNDIGGVRLCYVDYWKNDALVQHLKRYKPKELKDRIRFRHISKVPHGAGGKIIYLNNTGAIQIRNARDGNRALIWFWQPSAAAIAPYETWFWKEARRYSTNRAKTLLNSQFGGDETDAIVPEFDEKHSVLQGSLDPRTGIATALVVFGLFFVCVYLMPSMSCEERERGTLLAQALSPASPREILAAKFLFYPVLGLMLAVVLAGAYRPQTLLAPFFWLAVCATVTGSMGVGLTIAAIARTQRAASMGAMAYMFAVTLLLFICHVCSIPIIPNLALEYHCPRMIHALFADAVQWEHWASMVISFAISLGWIGAAVFLFRKKGWQT